MDVFIAWSGKASEKLAKALFKWLPDVIQTVDPFMSSESIRSGQRWFAEIGARLEKTEFAILCATPTNLKSTWMHFEAGAVSKNVEKSRVCALLLDVTTTALETPLSQFQHARATEDDILKLVLALDEMRPEKERLGSERAKRSFERCWPDLNAGIEDARVALRGELSRRGTPARRPVQEILAGMLEAQQGILTRLDNMQVQFDTKVNWLPREPIGNLGNLSGLGGLGGLGNLDNPLSSVFRASAAPGTGGPAGSGGLLAGARALQEFAQKNPEATQSNDARPPKQVQHHKRRQRRLRKSGPTKPTA